jgi:hypothetical protein
MNQARLSSGISDESKVGISAAKKALQSQPLAERAGTIGQDASGSDHRFRYH